jgi:hypothetical protein
MAKIYTKDDQENACYGVKRIYSYLKNYKDYTGCYSTVYRICQVMHSDQRKRCPRQNDLRYFIYQNMESGLEKLY